jgi:hypothetical protein
MISAGKTVMKPGDQIDVYYLPSDPDVSLPGEIRDRWDNELMFLFLVREQS